jgi:hypothetical protein
MPQQPSPPYLPTAIQYPRQINRWLDINAQNGSLRRTQTYITLPAFTESANWLGYSDIIAAFNFEGPNNFSLTGISTIPDPNYLLCIMWIDVNQVVHRYAIWNNVGEVMYIPYALYTGQLIGKNFRLEIWSVQGQATVSQATPITFYTSKLGIQDYRYGLDTVLVNPDSIITDFSISAEGVQSLPTDIGLLFQVDPFHNLSFTSQTGIFRSWTSLVDNTTELIPSGVSIVQASGLPNGCNALVITNDANYLYTTSAPLWGVQCMIITCKITGAAQSYLFSAYPSGIALFWNNGTVTSGGGTGPSVTGLGLNTWYTFIFYLQGGNATLSVYETGTGALIATNTALAPMVAYSNVVAMGNANCEIVEAILGSNTLSNADVQQIVTYMKQKYFVTNEFALPFVWPAGSTPQNNTI